MRTVSISEARRRLFALFDEVTSRERAVAIEHRNNSERAVLVSESYFNSLQRRLTSLIRDQAATSFRLFDSGQLMVDPDRPFDRIREEQNRRADEKRASL